MLGIAAGDIRVCINGACTNSDYSSRLAGDTLNVHMTYTHRPLVSYIFGALTFPANAEAELLVEEDAL